MTPDSILLSVRPRYANKILRGEKTVELRRVRPKVAPGDVIVMYVSSPQREVQALLTVQRVFETDTETLWDEVGREAGVTESEYRKYFEGSTTGVGIELCVAKALREPVTLDDLRLMSPGFRPPQSYRYVAGLAAGIRSLFSELWSESGSRAVHA